MRKSLAEKPQLKIDSFNKQKHAYSIHSESDKALKYIVVNRARAFRIAIFAWRPKRRFKFTKSSH